MPITIIAKDYGMSATRMNSMLYGFGVQYKVSGTWVLFSRYQNCGYTQTCTIRPNGMSDYIQVMYWTEDGRKFLYDFLKEKGISPKYETFFTDPYSNGRLRTRLF